MASSLFVLNAVLALVFLPGGSRTAVGGGTAAATAAKKKTDGDGDGDDVPLMAGVGDAAGGPAAAGAGGAAAGQDGGKQAGGAPSAAPGFWANLKQACSSGPTLRILAAKLIYGFLMRALGSQNFVGCVRRCLRSGFSPPS